MVARTLGTKRGDAALWTVRGAGMGSGLVVVLVAVMLGWLAWPALIGGLLGGAALVTFLALGGRTSAISRGAVRSAHRGIRQQASATPAQPDTRIAA